ncbi:MAG: flagellar hook-length control protein FliK [Deltaproteobacteria bacterium]|nr:flagellar hook-length control protein FliK [Deltaproteobacteria bacterium]
MGEEVENMHMDLFISQNLLEGLIRGNKGQNVREGNAFNALDSSGELKGGLGFLNTLAEFSNGGNTPRMGRVVLKETEELSAIQRFFETKNQAVLQDVKSLPEKTVFHLERTINDKGEKTQENMSNDGQSATWNSDNALRVSEEEVKGRTEKHDMKNVFEAHDMIKTESLLCGIPAIAGKDVYLPTEMNFDDTGEGEGLNHFVKGGVAGSGITVKDPDSLSAVINPDAVERILSEGSDSDIPESLRPGQKPGSGNEKGQLFGVKGELSGPDVAPGENHSEESGEKPKNGEKTVAEPGSLAPEGLKSPKEAGNLKVHSIQEAQESNPASSHENEPEQRPGISSVLKEGPVYKATASTAHAKGFSGQTEKAETPVLGFTEGQDLKKGETGAMKQPLPGDIREFEKTGHLKEEYLHKPDISYESVQNNKKDGLTAESRALKIDGLTLKADKTPVNQGSVTMEKSSHDMDNRGSIPDRATVESLNLKTVKTESKPDNEPVELRVGEENTRDKESHVNRLNLNIRSGGQENTGSRMEYSSREVFSRPDNGLRHTAVNAEKMHETAGDAVDRMPLNVETDVRGTQELSSTGNSMETNQNQISQAKDAGQIPRPLQVDLLNQVIEKAVMNMRSGQTSINIDLKPEYLGRLRMHISTENNQVVVRILAEVPLVKEIMEANLSQLRTELQNHGLEIQRFDVFLNDGSHKDNGGYENFLFGRKGEEQGEMREKLRNTEDTTPLTEMSWMRKGSGHIDYMA